MIIIDINNNKCTLRWDYDDQGTVNDLHKSFKIRHPNAFYIRRGSRVNWDGYVQYITSNGSFLTGLLPQVVRYLTENSIKFKIKDYRKPVMTEKVPKSYMGFEFRDYQYETVKRVVKSKVAGIPFHRGVINEAMNAGKTLIMIGIYLSFRDCDCIILLNDSNLFDQFKVDMPKFFTNSEWGYLRGKEFREGNIMICMAQTLIRRVDSFDFSRYKMVLVDECDLSDNSTYKSILTKLHNTSVRVGLSGTVFLSKLAKDKIKTQNIKGFFGDELIQVKSIELMKKGYSTPIKILINMGNTLNVDDLDYNAEYERGITKNGHRTKVALKRVFNYLDQGKYPILVITKYHNHVDRIFRIFSRHIPNKWVMKKVHHKTKDRKSIIQDFKNGKIDILVSSYFIKRGQNMPLIQVIINLGGGLGPEGPLQVIGRGVRKHKSKEIFYYEDFFDEGRHLRIHSKRRIVYYKNEGFEVTQLN